jgi:hypothetical protein
LISAVYVVVSYCWTFELHRKQRHFSVVENEST